MKVLSKVSMMVLILTVVASGSIKAAAPRIMNVIPMSYNAGENKWVALLGFTATIVRGDFSVVGPRYWESFDIDVTGLARAAMHERIRDRFAHYGLNLDLPTIQNGHQEIVGGRTYYFVNVPWSPGNRAANLYRQIQAYNQTLRERAERERRERAAQLANVNVPQGHLFSVWAHDVPPVAGIVDVLWIPVQEIIDSPQERTWGSGGQYSHQVDPLLKADLRAHWAAIARSL